MRSLSMVLSGLLLSTVIAFSQGQSGNSNGKGVPGGPNHGPGGAAALKKPTPSSGTGRLGNDTTSGPNAHGRGRANAASANRSAGKPGTSDGSTDASHPSHPVGPERALQQRLAAIDHMRDMALKNGNIRLLEVADQLELKARQQYQKKTGIAPPEPTEPTPTEPAPTTPVPTEPTPTIPVPTEPVPTTP